MLSKWFQLDVLSFFEPFLFFLQLLNLVSVEFWFGNHFGRIFIVILRYAWYSFDPLLSKERCLFELKLIIKNTRIAFDEFFLVEITEHEEFLWINLRDTFCWMIQLLQLRGLESRYNVAVLSFDSFKIIDFEFMVLEFCDFSLKFLLFCHCFFRIVLQWWFPFLPECKRQITRKDFWQFFGIREIFYYDPERIGHPFHRRT